MKKQLGFILLATISNIQSKTFSITLTNKGSGPYGLVLSAASSIDSILNFGESKFSVYEIKRNETQTIQLEAPDAMDICDGITTETQTHTPKNRGNSCTLFNCTGKKNKITITTAKSVCQNTSNKKGPTKLFIRGYNTTNYNCGVIPFENQIEVKNGGKYTISWSNPTCKAELVEIK